LALIFLKKLTNSAMPKIGQKCRRNQPIIYSELKKQRSIAMTDTGLEGLDCIAQELGLSRSELCEQIGRRIYVLQKVNYSSFSYQLDKEKPC